MQVENGQAGGAGEGQSGSGGAANGTGTTGSAGGASGSGEGGGAPQVVSKADHDRALADLHRFKTAAKANEDKVKELSTAVEQLKTQSATQANDYKSLYEAEKAKREAAETSHTSLLNNLVQTERHRAAYPALKKAGLRDDAESLIEVMDLSAIEIEATTSGRMVAQGVETFAEAMKVKYPYAFQKPSGPNVNGGTGSGAPITGERWTPAKLDTLERDCKKKGDLAPHRAAVAEWKKQGRPVS